MRAFILSAGKATRMGGLAPHGVKSLCSLGGRTLFDIQSEALRDQGWEPVLFTSVELPDLPHHVLPQHSGPGEALYHALRYADGPTLVVYADTLWTGILPNPGEWVGVADPPNLGRNWDVAAERFEYRFAREGEKVCVGLYCFTSPDEVRDACLRARRERDGEIGMADVLNLLPPPERHLIDGWTDVGDALSLRLAQIDTAWQHPSRQPL